MNAKNTPSQDATAWIIKENEGLSQAQQEEQNAWLQHPDHKKAYEENKRLLRECLDLDEAFIKGLREKHAPKPKPANRFPASRYLAASAVLIFALACGIFGANRYFIPTFERTYATTDAKMLGIVLPDDSTLDLDQKSQVRVRYYDTKRVIELLEGNALFFVTTDSKKPFSLTSKEVLVEVLGTTFEVLRFNDNTTINVLEGHVKVSYRHQNKSYLVSELKKLDSLTLDTTGKVSNRRTLENAEIAPWREDMIFFNKTSLKDASALFERYTKTKMVFETDALARLKVSGKFSTLRFESFLSSLELLHPIKAIKEGGEIKIVKK